MKYYWSRALLSVCLILTSAIAGQAAVFYAAANGSDSADGTSWSTAFKNINTAITAAADGDTVWVSNGVYLLDAEITVDKAINLFGNPGDTAVVLDGQETVRCFNVTAADHVISNFFITGGVAENGGGMRQIAAGTVTDCVFSNNSASNYGGGLYVNIIGSTVKNCRFIVNNSDNQGGAINSRNNNLTITNCYFESNEAEVSGSAIYSYYQTLIYNSEFTRNKTRETGGNKGGTVFFNQGESICQNCVFYENESAQDGGGIYAHDAAAVINCLIYNNTATRGGGILARSAKNRFINCTVVNNIGTKTTHPRSGGIYTFDGDSYAFTSINCIVYYNVTAGGVPDDYSNNVNSGAEILNNCTTAVFDPAVYPRCNGNLTDEPQFTALENNNYRLADNSPCVNTGVNLAEMKNMTDLEGFPRLDRFTGIVDIGCYEYIPKGALFRLH